MYTLHRNIAQQVFLTLV